MSALLTLRRRAAACLLFAGWLGFGLAGCDTLMGNRPSTGQAPPNSPMEHSAIESIPVPAGFVIVPERSMARKAGGMRIAQCEFTGSATPDDVARFYKQYMPSAKFTQKEWSLNNGEYVLRFESDNEVCNVRVRPTQNKSTLVVDIGPLLKGGAGEPRPSRQPYERP
jgi:hypothetical protein